MLTAKTKQYRLNISNLCNLAQLTGIEFNPKKPRQSIGIKTAKAQWDTVIQSNLFEYTEKSHRLYHPIQNIKTDIRRELFRSNGFRFNYDIENCYPTLIFQQAQQTGRIRKPLTILKEYVDNPSSVRAQLANEIQSDIKTAKAILIAKFNGATLRETGKIRSLLKPIQFYKLKNSVWFQQYNKDLDRAWSAIAKDQDIRSMSNSRKMQQYLTQEQRVMQAIRSEFNKKKYPMFLEHDGWRSCDHIDPYLLELAVRKATGYSVKIKLEVR
jgi:hypothetical protein